MRIVAADHDSIERSQFARDAGWHCWIGKKNGSMADVGCQPEQNVLLIWQKSHLQNRIFLKCLHCFFFQKTEICHNLARLAGLHSLKIKWEIFIQFINPYQNLFLKKVPSFNKCKNLWGTRNHLETRMQYIRSFSANQTCEERQEKILTKLV